MDTENKVDISKIFFSEKKGDRTANPKTHSEAHEGQENHQEQSAWIHQGEPMLDQLDKLLK